MYFSLHRVLFCMWVCVSSLSCIQTVDIDSILLFIVWATKKKKKKKENSRRRWWRLMWERKNNAHTHIDSSSTNGIGPIQPRFSNETIWIQKKISYGLCSWSFRFHLISFHFHLFHLHIFFLIIPPSLSPPPRIQLSSFTGAILYFFFLFLLNMRAHTRAHSSILYFCFSLSLFPMMRFIESFFIYICFFSLSVNTWIPFYLFATLLLSFKI